MDYQPDTRHPYEEPGGASRVPGPDDRDDCPYGADRPDGTEGG